MPGTACCLVAGISTLVVSESILKTGFFIMSFHEYARCRGTGPATFCPSKAEFFFGSFRGTVWEKVSVCSSRDGNGTGRWEATWLTGRDRTTRLLGGIWERVGNLVRKSVGNIVGNLVENMVKKRCREWLGTQWGTGAGDNGRERGKCYRVLYTTQYTYICVQ